MASNDGKIRMMVKNAAQAKDFPLDLATTASVGDLKAELQRSYPGQPRPAQQKLIFAGRLLTDDSQSIAQLITSSKYDVNTPQAVHLVLPPPSLHSSSSGLPSSPPLNRNFVQPDLRRSAPAGLGVPMPGNAQPHPRFVPGNGVPPPFARPQPVPFVPAPAVPAPAVAPAAAGGAGLLGRQNWSLLVKLVIILYILAQGGGSWRLSILTLGAFLVYLYQVGLFPRLNRRAAPQAAPAAAPAQAAAPERVEVEQQGEGGAEAQPQQQDAGVPPTAQATQPVARTGVWREVENLFLPLLYSLIPTWQPEAVVQPVPLPGGQPPQMHNHPHQE